MAQGFMGGLLWGGFLAVAGVSVVSLLSPLPTGPSVSAQAPVTTAQSDGPSSTGTVGNLGADADLVEVAPTAPGTEGTGADDLNSMAGADTSPAARPAVGGATEGMTDPANGAASSGVELAGDKPVAPVVPGTAPAAPGDETELSISTEPAQPAAPEVADVTSGFGSTQPETEAAPEVVASVEAAPETGSAVAPVTQPAAEATPDPSTDTAAAPSVADEPAAGDAGSDPSAVPQPSATQDESPLVPAAPLTLPATQPQSNAPEADTSTADTSTADISPADPSADTGAPRIAALPQAGAVAGETRPSIGTQVVPLTQRDQVAAVTPEPGLRPIEAYAAAFDNPDNKPLMAIVLIDGDGSIGVEALQDFPYPLSFAVDPAAPGAAEKMARHRAAGFEVVTLVDLPGTATAQDAEVSLSAGFGMVAETVAILEGTGTGIQGNRGLSDQVTAIAAATGRGLITQNNGLNTVQKLAARSGVPAATVFRDFDGAGQTPTVMRRFLDQAAFRAGQEGVVIMLGRVQPDTVSALLLWGLQDRADRVALAPISAALLEQAQ